jgi:hypothetical protein
MLITTLKAKELARQIESNNLPTPVTQDFASANRTANDLVNPIGEVMLLKNYRLGWNGYAYPNAADQQVKRFVADTRGFSSR